MLLASHPWEKGTCIAECAQSKAARLLCTLGCVPPVVLCHHFQFLSRVSQTKGIVLLALAQRAEEGTESWKGNFLYPGADGQGSFVYVPQSGAWAKKML